MIPIALSGFAPSTTLGDLFGPLATIAVLGVVAGLVLLVGVIALQTWAAAHTRRDATASATPPREERSSSNLRPAA